MSSSKILDANSRFRMSRSNVATGCLVGAVLLFFMYTSSERAEVQRLGVSQYASAASLRDASIVAQPASASLNSSLSPSSVQRMAALYMQQAELRKWMFEVALSKWFPTVGDVFLPLVPEAFCPSLVRLGYFADGGKWVCNPWAMPKGGVVFSLGSRNDISFEQDFQRATGQAAAIITVDRTAASEQALAGLAAINAKFVHAEIADVTEVEMKPPHYTVADLMKKMGHEHIEILKMDIEGAEVSVLPQFLNGNSVCQIMVEIHNVWYVPKLLRAIADAGFLLLSFELNTSSVRALGSGISEYSFIHESCLHKYGATLLASYLKE